MFTKNKKIRVLHAMRQGQIGGGESHVYDLVCNLDKTVFDPIVLSFTDGPIMDKLRQKKIPVYVVDTLQPFHFTTFNNVQAIMRAEEIDILHAHGTRALSNTLFTARTMGLPVIYTVYGWAFHRDQGFTSKKLRELSERMLMANVDVTIHVSSEAVYKGLQLIGKDNSLMINYGINLSEFNAYRPMKDLRGELGLNPTKITIGFINRFKKQKDPFTFIKAVANLKDRCDNLQFLMMGEGELLSEAKAFAITCGVKELILFYPMRDDRTEVLNTIDIYTSTDLSAGLKPEMMEAMAMHKAIAATNVDGTKEMIKHNFNGLLFETEDHDALSACWLRLANDIALREELGERAYKTIKKNYNLSETVLYNESIYKNFLQKKRSA